MDGWMDSWGLRYPCVASLLLPSTKVWNQACVCIVRSEYHWWLWFPDDYDKTNILLQTNVYKLLLWLWVYCTKTPKKHPCSSLDKSLYELQLHWFSCLDGTAVSFHRKKQTNKSMWLIIDGHYSLGQQWQQWAENVEIKPGRYIMCTMVLYDRC